MLVEGSHFLLSSISPYQLGWKSAAVNISDIAAMGGSPSASFLSLALPSKTSEDFISKFICGYNAVSSLFGCTLLGGDTTASPDRLCINVTVLGTCPSGKALRRDGAREGDLICVTGTLGDSAAGLKFVLDPLAQSEHKDYLIERHYLPMPRVLEGLALSQTPGVHSMMDISDGVGSDLRHILKASGVGADVDCSTLPHSSELLQACSQNGWDPVELALSGGEDYELLFTASPDAQILIPHTVIGVINNSQELRWSGGGSCDYQGFRHF